MTEIKFSDLNAKVYTEMRMWCREQFGREALWTSQLDNLQNAPLWYTRGDYPKDTFGGNAETGKALFVFKEPKYATFFSLKWSDVNRTRDVVL